jgi:hypothetical protein
MADPEDAKAPDYLWDKAGEPDPEVARLEYLLAPLGHDNASFEAPGRASAANNPRRSVWKVAAAVGTLVAAAAATMLLVSRPREDKLACAGGAGFAFDADHSVRCEHGRAERGTLAVGGFIETSEGSAKVTVADIGSVELAARSRLSLRQSARSEHRLALDRGKLHARVLAPPRLFVVETPSATAIDLGCEYTLEVDELGAGRLRVTSGQVELAAKEGAIVLVPAGTLAHFTRERGVGAPVAEGAPAALRQAVARFDRGEARVAEVLAAARPEDSITLVNLLSLVAPGDREQVFDRLAQLSPPPVATEKAGVVAGDPRAIEAWRTHVVEGWMKAVPP